MAIRKKEFYRNLVRLALPITLQSLMLASVAAADALMLGKVEQNEMTAVSQATQIQFIQNMFLTAIAAAGSVLGAQYWGKGDRRTLEDIFHMILRFCGIVSILFFAACECAPGLLMRVFTHDEPLIAIGSAYLRIAGWSYLLTGYFTVLSGNDENYRPCKARRFHQRMRGLAEYLPERGVDLRTAGRAADAGARGGAGNDHFPRG